MEVTAGEAMEGVKFQFTLPPESRFVPLDASTWLPPEASESLTSVLETEAELVISRHLVVVDMEERRATRELVAWPFRFKLAKL